jgi:hypothetical protein
MLRIPPLEHKHTIADGSEAILHAVQLSFGGGRTIVIHGDSRVSPTCNAKLTGNIHSGLAALAIDLDVHMVAVLSRMPGILPGLKRAPKLFATQPFLELNHGHGWVGKKMVIDLQGRKAPNRRHTL